MVFISVAGEKSTFRAMGFIDMHLLSLMKLNTNRLRKTVTEGWSIFQDRETARTQHHDYRERHASCPDHSPERECSLLYSRYGRVFSLENALARHDITC